MSQTEEPPQATPQTKGSWLRLATLMGSKPEMAILRTFRKLNVTKLLHMQSEIVRLEEEYKIYWDEDAESKCPITRKYTMNWDTLEKSEGEGGCDQRDRLFTLREKLKEYSEYLHLLLIAFHYHLLELLADSALLQQIELCKCVGPGYYHLKPLQMWLANTDGNNSDLRGMSWDVWEELEDKGADQERKADYIILSDKYKKRDHFTRRMGSTLLVAFQRYIRRFDKNPDEELGIVEYKNTYTPTAGDIVCMFLSPLLATLPMVILYFFSNTTKRLGILSRAPYSIPYNFVRPIQTSRLIFLFTQQYIK
ncbi:MAG: hypothetical protein M1834_007200 [Cirrosporium novae-zelandiae]|nr:MAG: hypothetical protein M1834_007200 [Cirrosporium novae-zelandiae]